MEKNTILERCSTHSGKSSRMAKSIPVMKFAMHWMLAHLINLHYGEKECSPGERPCKLRGIDKFVPSIHEVESFVVVKTTPGIKTYKIVDIPPKVVMSLDRGEGKVVQVRRGIIRQATNDTKRISSSNAKTWNSYIAESSRVWSPKAIWYHFKQASGGPFSSHACVWVFSSSSRSSVSCLFNNAPFVS
jgi:hypothetical protein